MPAVACKVVSLQGRFFKVVSVSLREDFFSGDVVKKLQLSLFCIVRRARYRRLGCLCYRLHYRRPSYRRLPSSLVIVACLPRYCPPVCACYRPPSTVTCLHYCRPSYRRLPSLSPLELLVTAYNADV